MMKKYIIEPQGGIRIEAQKGQSITIKDIEGSQVADFFAEIKGTHNEYLSPSVTLDCNESLHIGVGTILYSNLYRPVFEVLYDGCGTARSAFSGLQQSDVRFLLSKRRRTSQLPR